jgi:hypothetical protein
MNENENKPQATGAQAALVRFSTKTQSPMDFWCATRGLTLEEKGFLLDLILQEAGCGKIFVSKRVTERLSAALGSEGFLWPDGKLKIRSPFEIQTLAKVYGRQAIPHALRVAVYERDGYSCVSCGRGTHLTCDHIIPVSSGGETALENIATRCLPCNARKGARNGRAA